MVDIGMNEQYNRTIAVMADVHGNLAALEAVLADARKNGASQVWVAGDLSNGGPYPLETLNLLREVHARMILGNSEKYLLDFDAGKFPASAQTSQQWAPLRWTLSRLDGGSMDYLQGLPQQAVFMLPGGMPARVVHGSPRGISEGLVPDGLPEIVTLFETANLTSRHQAANVALSTIWPGVMEPLLICGHTHIGWVQRENGRMALNPGSVGTPINGDPRGQYALLHRDGAHWRAELRAVVYDLDRVRRAYRETGLLEEGGAFARAFLLSNETGLNIAWFLVSHVMLLMDKLKVDGANGFPDDVWHEAVRTFPWQTYEARR